MRVRAKRGVHRYRRRIQVVFLLVFFALLTMTVWPLGRVYLGAFLVADPLIAANSLANGVWKPAMVLALVMIALPLVAGRAFCGYACPTGTLIEMTGGKSRRSRLSPKARRVLRRLPAFILIACAGLLLFASSVFLFIDPLATLTRSATVLLYPLLDRVLRVASDTVSLVRPLSGAVDTVDAALAGRLIFTQPLVYGLQLGVLGMFAAILGMSWLEPRLWCRDLCPLGALLGTVARAAPLRRRVDTEACTKCGRCAKVCPLDAIGEDFHSTDTTRCQLGFECADTCPEGAISFGVGGAKTNEGPGRRAFLGMSGVALITGFFAYTGISHRARDARLIRPPGAPPERDVLALCTRCGQCMKTCPTNVLQPSLAKSGILGVFTPEMDFRVGFCEWSCAECGKVCPTGAITPLSLDAKHKTKIGRAYIDRNRCIPWADGKTCLVCQELCPVPDKAIVINEAEVRTPEGKSERLGRPEVIAEKCIGCGVCEYDCPVPHESAIVVRAIEPERHG